MLPRTTQPRSRARRSSFAAAIVGAILLFSPLARAQAATATRPGSAPWYGWQILAAGLPLGALAAWTAGETVLDTDLPQSTRDRWNYAFYASAPLFVASAPIVHLANGQHDRVGSSLTLQVASPVVLALAGSLVGLRFDCSDNRPEWGAECWPQGMIAGLSAGFLAAPVLDALFIARPVAPPYGERTSDTRFSASLSVLPTSDGRGRSLALVGSF